MHHYIYDAGGQRVLKASGGIESVYQNGTIVQETAWLQDYKMYPSAYVVRDANGTTTKHYYNGSERIASRVVGGRDNKESPISDEYNIEEIRQGIQSLLKLDISKQNPKLEIKYIPKEKQEATEKIVTKAAYYGLYYFHPDHLGTATYLSDENGNPYQFFLNLPFGETMAEQRTGAFQNQYKFNGKELDEETGFYYYGARYYNPQISSWLSIDPIAVYNPVLEIEHYIDGQHNGGVFNSGNLNVYGYTYQNPIMYIDPNGKQVYFNLNGSLVTKKGTSSEIKILLTKSKNKKKVNGVINSGLVINSGFDFSVSDRAYSLSKSDNNNEYIYLIDSAGDASSIETDHKQTSATGAGNALWNAYYLRDVDTNESPEYMVHVHGELVLEGLGNNRFRVSSPEPSGSFSNGGKDIAYKRGKSKRGFNHPFLILGYEIEVDGEGNISRSNKVITWYTGSKQFKINYEKFRNLMRKVSEKIEEYE